MNTITRDMNKALLSVKKLFDENEHLKEQVRQLRKEKREIIHNLQNEKVKQDLKFKKKRTLLINELKAKKKQLENQLKEHPRLTSLREVREKKKFHKLTEKQSHQYKNIEYEYIKLKSAFRGYSTSWLIRKKLTKTTKNKSYHDILFYDDTEKEILKADSTVILYDTINTRKRLIEEQYDIIKGMSINEKVICVFRKWYDDENRFDYINVRLPKDTENKQCSSKILNKSRLNDILQKHNKIFINSIDEFIQNGSNYQLYAIKGLEMDVDVYKPLGGSSFIDLPEFIKNKKCCINVMNNDNECFVWAIQSYLSHNDIKKHYERISSYPKEEHIDIVEKMKKIGVSFPFVPNDITIKRVENHLNVSINIYTFELNKSCERYPIYITKKPKEKHINLLYFSNEDESQYHYTWIKNFNRFMYDATNSHCSKFFCMKCLLHFDSEEKLRTHNIEYPNCSDGKAKIEYPK